MSKLTAPLLSFTASGQIAKTLVASTWKGIPYMRKYVIPANPKTDAQIAQRDCITAAVYAWKNFFTGLPCRTAWGKTATADSRAMSGFNAFSSNAIKLILIDADASMDSACVAFTGNTAKWTMKNLDDGAAGDEAGTFEIWVGSTIGAMTLKESVAIDTGTVTSTDLGDTDDVLFVKLRKGGRDRSGIYEITLIA